MQINVDLGEGGENDNVFMPYITSCSIACGGHYGSIKTIKKTIALSLRYGINIGSHPSYPDKKNFGRKSINIKLNEFQDSIRDQLLNFKNALSFFSIEWHHCKAHGALYNDIADNGKLTDAYLEVLSDFSEINYLILPISKPIIESAERMNFKVLKEVFSDRNYDKVLSLIPRSDKKSIISSSNNFLMNLKFLLDGKIQTSDGVIKNVLYDTICLHSDTLQSIEFINIMTKEINKKQL